MVDASTRPTAEERNAWLRLDRASLLRQCRQERYRSSGPGGQRRNKVETAIRLHHLPTNLVVQAEEARILEENRARAVRRMRERIALEVRAPLDLDAPALPPELIAYRGREGTLSVNQRNRAYPLIVAVALDALVAAEGSYARAARALGLTTAQLIRFLRSDPQVWRAVEQLRQRVRRPASSM